MTANAQFAKPIMHTEVEALLNTVGTNWKLGRNGHWNVTPLHNFKPWTDSEATAYRKAIWSNPRLGITQAMVKYVGRYFDTYTAEYCNGFRVYTIDPQPETNTEAAQLDAELAEQPARSTDTQPSLF